MKIGRLSGLVSVLVTVLATNLLVSAELYALKYTPLLPKAHDPFLELFLFVLLPVSTIAISVIMYRSTSVQPFHKSVLQREIDAFSGPVSDTKRERSSRPAGWPLAPILLVHACDHYLEIRTSEGKVFLKGRMKDAVTYLALFDGAQVHRSWWVAKSFVTTIERQGRDWVIFSEFGDRIPIGRGRTKLLRELDWPFE
ncbi:LytTR family DNA-binding domain-containing protein [uncultured Roseibium sp.]|uniref:LytTR family DNA-binding domain-containing protein n=1 Tax=uncultured Roseibium sp. TaxID=1936171 RepID=UPI002606EB2D|nr:LytTR family DNA-binding domain-containing protein [uncultured Roseibium sp.]